MTAPDMAGSPVGWMAVWAAVSVWIAQRGLRIVPASSCQAQRIAAWVAANVTADDRGTMWMTLAAFKGAVNVRYDQQPERGLHDGVLP